MIHLYRRYFSYSLPVRSSRFLAEASSGNDTYNRIVRYMEEHLGERMTIDRICRDNLVGRSQLQKLFRDTKGCGVIEFFSMMKIDTAKQMIRDNQLNFTHIKLDASFSPVRKVAYTVEQARVGQMTNYDKLILEVWTDGSVLPEDAIAYSAKIIKDQISVFISFDERISGESGGEGGGSADINDNLWKIL